MSFSEAWKNCYEKSKMNDFSFPVFIFKKVHEFSVYLSFILIKIVHQCKGTDSLVATYPG